MSNCYSEPAFGGGTKPGELPVNKMAIANVMAVLEGNRPLNP